MPVLRSICRSPCGSGSLCLFANFAEAMAEGRGKAQADTLRKARSETTRQPACLPRARRPDLSPVLNSVPAIWCWSPWRIHSRRWRGYRRIASVDESAITGESAPVIRESGGDRSAVTGGTSVLSDSIIVRITSNPGETFLDRMIALVEGAERQKTPNEIALEHSSRGLTIIFLLAVVTLQPFACMRAHLNPVYRAGCACSFA